MTKSELRRQWRDRVTAFRASGLSATKWCAEQNLKLHQLRYWLKRLSVEPYDSTNLMSPTRWLSVQTSEPSPIVSHAVFQVRVGPAVIEVQPGYDPVLLAQLVQTLAEC